MQFLPGCGRPCGLAGRPRVPGEARRCLRFSSSQELGYDGSEGFLSHFAPFFALLRLSGVERQFSQLGALDDEEFFVIEGWVLALTPGVAWVSAQALAPQISVQNTAARTHMLWTYTR